MIRADVEGVLHARTDDGVAFEDRAQGFNLPEIEKNLVS